MLKAVLFDMDGVIIDSEPQHARAAVLALKKYNVDITIDYAYQFIGTTTYHMCKQMIEDFHISATAEELLKANEVMKDELTRTEGHLAIPYVIDLMKDLKRHGIMMMIASSSSAQNIQEVMQYLQIEDIMDGYISGTTVAHPKPAPDIFVAAAKCLGVDPSECIVIEDSHHGVTAAAAAHITSIGYINPNSGNQDLAQAAILVEGFDEVDYDFIHRVYQHAQMQPATILTTERLILRELALEEIENYCEICNHSKIREQLEDYSGNPKIEKEKLIAYIKNIYHFYDYGLWGVYLKGTNRLIGRCGLEYKMLNQEDIFELSYLLDADYHGHGYATECVKATLHYGFKKLGLNTITALIDKNNTSSRKVALKAGMKLIGEVHRNHHNYDRYEINKCEASLK